MGLVFNSPIDKHSRLWNCVKNFFFKYKVHDVGKMNVFTVRSVDFSTMKIFKLKINMVGDFNSLMSVFVHPIYSAN